MKKAASKKAAKLTLPKGVKLYKGPTRGLKAFLEEPDSLTSGGTRSVHRQSAGRTGGR